MAKSQHFLLKSKIAFKTLSILEYIVYIYQSKTSLMYGNGQGFCLEIELWSLLNTVSEHAKFISRNLQTSAGV